MTARSRPSSPTRLGKKVAILTLVIAGTLLVSACSTTSGDFKSEAETFLQSPDLAEQAGYKFTQAKCAAPATTTVGTRFTCTATDNDGDDWEFVVEISGDRELTVISGDLKK